MHIISTQHVRCCMGKNDMSERMCIENEEAQEQNHEIHQNTIQLGQKKYPVYKPFEICLLNNTSTRTKLCPGYQTHDVSGGVIYHDQQCQMLLTGPGEQEPETTLV